MRALELTITGVVQGVGFRPFIYRLATGRGLRGYVKNVGGSAVIAVVEGEPSSIDSFRLSIDLEKPSAAYVESIKAKELPPSGYSGFAILESDPKANAPSMIPADLATCGDCMGEVLDSTSRFHRYPFNSCAVCGPRYSIIETTPYDRPNTSMKPFVLCDDCRREYEDPGDVRRFHVQGISCPNCGPRVWLEDRNGRRMGGRDPIREAGRLLSQGKILAVKGLGGFHIAASASNDEVVLKLRERKRRPSKPFAVMALDLDVVSSLGVPDGAQRALLASPERPIVLVNSRKRSPLSQLVAPGLRQVGLFLPYTPLHSLLLREDADRFAIMTSGNPPGEPMCVDARDAKEKLSSFVDFFLLHNRRIVNRVDDSVVRMTDGRPTLLRRGRGYAPRWVDLPVKLSSPAVCFGAMLQNAGAVGFADKAVLTQYVGDTDEYFTSLELERYIKLLLKNYGILPREATTVCDLHPAYPSTAMAEAWSRKHRCRLRRVQHHWAHLASVAAENLVEGEMLGIAVDGTGYGLDGNIWGGEVLRFDRSGFSRLGHLEYQPLPGGDLASTYPARMLASILSRFLDDSEIFKLYSKKDLFKGLPRGPEELEVVLAQCRGPGILTSSTGRVLDAASALLGVCLFRSYEGEPAIRLEAASRRGGPPLRARLRRGDVDVVETAPLFEQVLELSGDAPASQLAFSIQRSIGLALASAAVGRARRSDRFLAVSGGAAVNTPLMEGIREGARDKLKVLVNAKVPPGDGGVALGQCFLADSRD
ncbi:MAG TPA: carbamoyltransferase HypF [Conexivisphaerales archaeon]|nr:carbamoyltransferase HypF [Conexivisphaerales archaeon]